MDYRVMVGKACQCEQSGRILAEILEKAGSQSGFFKIKKNGQVPLRL